MTYREIVDHERDKRGMPPMAAEAVMAYLEIENKKKKGHWDDSVDHLKGPDAFGPGMWVRGGFDWLEEEIERELLKRRIRALVDGIEAEKPTA